MTNDHFISIFIISCILLGIQSSVSAQSSDWVYSPYAQYLTNDTTIPPPVGEPADAALSCFRHDTIYVLVMPTGQLYIWLRPDPLLDKYINLSPYAYCNGNPLIFVDPNGRDTLHFDAKGNYTHRVQSEGPHIGIWHKSNNSTREFRFQDPNDANRFMTDEEYLDYISNGGTLDRLDGIIPVSLSSVYKATRPSISDRLKGRYLAALSGKANGSMDYMRVNEPNYNMAGSQSYLMLVDGIPLAQQPYNMGNMLWGLKMHRLGFSLPACLLGAHVYTIYGGMTGKYTKIELDSFDDQCSIILGYMLWLGF